MKRILIFLMFIFFILLISLGYCQKIGISPASLDFNGSINEKICRNFTLYGDGIMEGEDKWSLVKSRNLNSYVYPGELKIEYEKNPYIQSGKTLDICITSKKQGNFNGVLIYSKASSGAGIWLNVEIKGNAITGFAIENFDLNGINPINLVLVLIILALILIIITVK